MNRLKYKVDKNNITLTNINQLKKTKLKSNIKKNTT